MAEIGRIQSAEIQLLKKEIEVQGDLLNQERMERKIEVDHLKLEIDSLKKLLDQLNPGFLKRFEEVYQKEREIFNPELDFNSSKDTETG